MKGTLNPVLTAILFGCPLLVYSTAVSGAPAFYGGTVEFIQPYVGGVGIKVYGTELDDCQSQRVWLKDSVLGEKTVDRLYSMALSAQASGRRVDFVIDKAINGPGGECVATGNSKIHTD